MKKVDSFLTVSELSALLESGEFSSRDLTNHYLERLETHGEELGAVVTVTRERAEREAAKADQEISAGKWRGPLHGIPYGVKDLLATTGIPTTWGAEPYRDQVFDYDATVVTKLGDAGAVLCAKLAMVELAGGFGYNDADASFTGPGRSPWNSEFWSGGSSSGPGAAVAAGLVPFAIGSETSGSILTPSAFSGTTGLRPTYGVVSRYGAMALCWTLDKLGPMTRSAEDCSIVMNAIAGLDSRDPSSRPESLDWSTGVADRKTIGIINATTEKVQPEVRDNFLASLEVFRSLGHHIVEIEIPDLPYGTVVSTIVDAEGASAFEDLLTSGKAKLLRCEADRTGGYVSAATLAIDYLRSMRVRRKIRKELLTLFESVDLIAAPTRSTVAYPIDGGFQDAYPGISGGPSTISSMNLVGAPAVAMPNGFGENGLPTSLQLIGPPLSDPEVLRVGAAFQNRTHHHRQSPPAYR